MIRKLMAREKGALPEELWSFQQRCSSTIPSSPLRSFIGTPLYGEESLSRQSPGHCPITWHPEVGKGVKKSCCEEAAFEQIPEGSEVKS